MLCPICISPSLAASFHFMILNYSFQVSIVGDFSEEEVESCVLDYLGTVSGTSAPTREEHIEKISFQPFPSDLHFQQV
jgi:hypothetical protein